jgi:sugar lactone lactonase YvrE
MYVVGTANKTIYQYSLSTAYRANTASYTSLSANVAAQDTNPHGIRFNNTNTVLYMLGATNKTVYQYDVTYSNIATLSYASLSFSVNSQESSPRGLAFGNSMSAMYIVGTANAAIYQYSLGTAGNVATAVYNAPGSFSVSSQDSTPTGLEFSLDGYTCYVVGSQNAYVYQYSLSTAWDITTASYTGYKFSTFAQEGAPTGLYRSEAGSMAYVSGAYLGTARVWQFNTGLGTIATSNSLYLGGTIQAIGNIQTQGYILGNGALMYGITATNIANTTSNITAGTAGGNITVGVGGTPNVAIFSSGGITATNFYGNGAALTGITSTPPPLNINLQQNYGGF